MVLMSLESCAVRRPGPWWPRSLGQPIRLADEEPACLERHVPLSPKSSRVDVRGNAEAGDDPVVTGPEHTDCSIRYGIRPFHFADVSTISRIADTSTTSRLPSR